MSTSSSVGQQVGNIRILPLLDGYATMNAREILVKPGVADPWLDHADLLNDKGEIEFTMGAYLIVTGDRRVMVDAGVGRVDNDEFHGGQMLDSLASHGYQPEDVTDVVLTHLHFDHVGWTTQKGAIVFPKATYRCHQADWEHFVTGGNPDAGAVRKLSPLDPQLELFDADHTLAPGVDTRHAPGHTPGSTILVVSDGNDRAMLVGDVVHCTAELTENEWEALFDVDRELARQTRIALARELEEGGIPVGAAHFPGLRFGRLLAGQGQRQFTFG